MSNVESSWKDMFINSGLNMGLQKSPTYLKEAFGGLVTDDYIEALQGKLPLGYLKQNNPKLVALLLSEIRNFVSTVSEVDNVGQWEVVNKKDNDGVTRGVMFFWQPATGVLPVAPTLPTDEELTTQLKKFVHESIYNLLVAQGGKLLEQAKQMAWLNRGVRAIKVTSPMRYAVILSNTGWVAGLWTDDCIRTLLPLIEANSNIKVDSLTASFEVVEAQIANDKLVENNTANNTTDNAITKPTEEQIITKLDEHAGTSYSFDYGTVKPVFDGDTIIDYSLKYVLSNGVTKTNRWSTLNK